MQKDNNQSLLQLLCRRDHANNFLNNFIFINADDYGINSESNERICYCLNNNLISSTTMIANMSGFKDAVDNYHKFNFNGRVGFHINLMDGYPLSDNMKQLIKGDNLKIFQQSGLKHFYNDYESLAIYHEIKTQLQKILDNGIIPTHIDTHGHAHRYVGILKIINQISIEYNIQYIRRCMNLFINKDIKNIFLKRLYHVYFRYLNIESSRYFTSVKAYVTNRCKLLNTELMCHPGDKNEYNFLLSDLYKIFLAKRKSDIVFEPFFLQKH